MGKPRLALIVPCVVPSAETTWAGTPASFNLSASQCDCALVSGRSATCRIRNAGMCDIAKAIRWVHDHAQEYGGDPNSIFVMGHSAGAHLAALVCTDDRYLKAESLSLSIIKGCVPVDVSVYDIPKRFKDSKTVPPATFKAVFGESEEAHRDLSPGNAHRQGEAHPGVPDPARR